jgi:hypothetical protein
MPQSRSTMSSGVPANADMVTLSSTSSSGRGSSSGTSSKPGEPDSSIGCTSATVCTRCQAIRVRSADTPAISFGRNMCRR